jgi:hypothetical protein
MKKVEKEIADGEAGIDQTVSEIWRLVNRDINDSRVQKYAKKLVGTTDLETAKKTFSFVWKNYPYKSDPAGVEHFTAPVYLLKKEFTKHLDCDDLVGILAALLLANKIPVRIKVIQWRRNDFTHVVLDAKIGEYWIPLDPVKKGSGFGSQITEAQPGVIFRQKIYNNPMGTLVTLEDNCISCGKNRTQQQPTNQNIITVNTGTTNTQGEGFAGGGGLLATLIQSIPGMGIINKNSNPQQPTQAGEKVIEKVIEKPYPVEVIKKQVVKEPYPVIKKILIPARAINNPNVTNYREFY